MSVDYSFMNDTEAAWVAGLFEGEGSVVLCRSSNGTHRKYVRLQLGSTDLDVLEKLKSYAGGSIYGPRQKEKESHKDFWIWMEGKQDRARELIQAMMPWLGERRKEKAMSVLQEVDAQPAIIVPSLEERFMGLVEINDDDCWVWQGYVDGHGFGTWQVHPGVRKQAHRWILEHRGYEVPARLNPPSCGVKHCVNPEHWLDCEARDET